VGNVTLSRYESDGEVTDSDLELLRLLAPHIPRAVAISRLLDRETLAASTFAAAIEALAVAVILVDHELTIIHANRHAREALSAGRPVRSDGKRLLLSSIATTKALRTAVGRAARNDPRLGGSAFGIPVGDAALPSVAHVLADPQAALSRADRSSGDRCRVRRASGISTLIARRCSGCALRFHPFRVSGVRAGCRRPNANRDRGITRHRAEHGEDTSLACVRENWPASASRSRKARSLSVSANLTRCRCSMYCSATDRRFCESSPERSSRRRVPMTIHRAYSAFTRPRDRIARHESAHYKMQVHSSAFTPGMYSLAHHHSGVEAVYVLEGEACFETPTRAVKLRKGETLALPADVPMRTVVTGSAIRASWQSSFTMQRCLPRHAWRKGLGHRSSRASQSSAGS
jgi:mannose-6-phosphate isomerase-like protein (cupin superfamily)